MSFQYLSGNAVTRIPNLVWRSKHLPFAARPEEVSSAPQGPSNSSRPNTIVLSRRSPDG